MIKVVRSNSKNPDFIGLVKDLDLYLKQTDGDEHEFYNQFNSIENLNHVIDAYLNDLPVGCGAFKKYNETKVEIKRMFTKPEARNNSIAAKVLSELEIWAAQIGYTTCILETGIRQEEAVSFYKKNNYVLIEKYGQYKNMSNSLCFEKSIA